MPQHKTHREEKKAAGARKAASPPRVEIDPTPVSRSPQVLDERKSPIPVKRPKNTGKPPRMDPTRVAGPIRLVLEPMLWVAFVSGVVWALIALDPGLREPEAGVVVYEYALPLAMLVSALLLISSVTALMWLPSSTSATRARTSFAGLGMLASGWLFAKLHPVDSADFQRLSWGSIGIGMLLVAICAVPWPTGPARVARRPGPLTWLAVAVLSGLIAVVSVLAWEAARMGLVGDPSSAETGWDTLLPFLVVLAVLLAAVRFVLRRPRRANAA